MPESKQLFQLEQKTIGFLENIGDLKPDGTISKNALLKTQTIPDKDNPNGNNNYASFWIHRLDDLIIQTSDGRLYKII